MQLPNIQHQLLISKWVEEVIGKKKHDNSSTKNTAAIIDFRNHLWGVLACEVFNRIENRLHNV